MPTLQKRSLFLSSKESNLVCGNILLPLLSLTIQEFQYAIRYYAKLQFDRNDAIVASWPPSHPIMCYIGDTFHFFHTIRWYCACIPIHPSIGNTFSSQKYHDTCYDQRVERLVVFSDRNFTLGKALAVVAQYRRMRELTVWVRVSMVILLKMRMSFEFLFLIQNYD